MRYLVTAILVATLVVLSMGEVRGQGSAKVSFKQKVQQSLTNAGFDPGPADGAFGPKTRKAIRAWQRANGHTETGYLNRDQLRLLFKHVKPSAKKSLELNTRRKCKDLYGTYLKGNHVECWQEVESHNGCFLWNPHYHTDRSAKWLGECRGGVAVGHGELLLSSGSAHFATESTGMLADGKKHGSWVEKRSDGSRFEGKYLDGKRYGNWLVNWSNGDKYNGGFRDGKRNGQGIMTWPTGTYYEGEYLDDKENGHGIYKWASGSRYEGEYRNGKPHGFGTMTFASGETYKGIWDEGCFIRNEEVLARIATTWKACEAK